MDNDNTGMRLLKKGKQGIIHILFSRLGLMVILLLIQVMLILLMMIKFTAYIPHYFGIMYFLGAALVIYLINSGKDPTSKITWLAIILVAPVFGFLLLCYTQSDIGHNALKNKLKLLTEETMQSIPQPLDTYEKLKEESPETASLAAYIHRSGCYPVFENTDVKYFPLGEDKFAELLIQLEKAESFIFMEYFIIGEGIMWGKILEILARKAKEGVEVRVMYDGTCEFSTLSHDYPKRLKALGIQCKMFCPVTPFLSTHYNYRDHRKILVIDGKVAFTGGINLADEYINAVNRFGHWKDTAVMLTGEAVKSFTLMFLQMWNVDEKPEKSLNPDKYISIHSSVPDAPGYVIPYGDCPLDDDKVGENVYIDILNRANKYVHIMSPYLILDGELENAIKFAAERGVDVRLILPGIPDKKIPYGLAWTHYASLIASGVKIYEYLPGFVHAKVFVSDDIKAVVGTINLDYRSLYHHFECAAYMYKTNCISDIEADFLHTQERCRLVTAESLRHESLIRKLRGYIIKVLSPLL